MQDIGPRGGERMLASTFSDPVTLPATPAPPNVPRLHRGLRYPVGADRPRHPSAQSYYTRRRLRFIPGRVAPRQKFSCSGIDDR